MRVLIHTLDICEDFKAVAATKGLEGRGGIQVLEMILSSFWPPYRSVDFAGDQVFSNMLTALRPVFRLPPTEAAVKHWIIFFHRRTKLAPFHRKFFAAKIVPFSCQETRLASYANRWMLSIGEVDMVKMLNEMVATVESPLRFRLGPALLILVSGHMGIVRIHVTTKWT